MNGKELLTVLGDINHKYYDEAENETFSDPQAHRSLRKPLLIAAAVAAMLLLAGCAYVVLSGSDWFKGFFSERIGQPLSSGQSVFIEENTQELAQRITVDGYTLTVESAIADARNAYFKLKLQGPPGASLDADIYWYTPRILEDGTGMEQIFYNLDDPELNYAGANWEGIDDGNPYDNSFSIMCIISQTINDDLPSLEAGVPYRLHITDLEGYYSEGNRSVRLSEDGVWDFDIVFDSINDDSVELITEPVTTSYHEVSIELTSLELQTMSIQAFHRSRDNSDGLLCFVDSAVVLKDGTRVPFRGGTSGPTRTTLQLASPIVLNEVDYVELRDGTRIPMP